MRSEVLDTMNTEELMEFWGRVHRAPMRVAREVFPDRRLAEAVAVVETLAAYASNRAALLVYRQRGDERGIVAYQTACNIHRGNLPGWAR